jgi:hypothetical protein
MHFRKLCEVSDMHIFQTPQPVVIDLPDAEAPAESSTITLDLDPQIEALERVVELTGQAAAATKVLTARLVEARYAASGLAAALDRLKHAVDWDDLQDPE